MSSADTWEQIQAVKCKRNSLRERLEKRKRDRQDILSSSALRGNVPITTLNDKKDNETFSILPHVPKLDFRIEQMILKILCDISLTLPITSMELFHLISSTLRNNSFEVNHDDVCNLLQKFASQKLVRVKEIDQSGEKLCFEIFFADNSKLVAMINDFDSAKSINEVESLSDKNNHSSGNVVKTPNPDTKVTITDDANVKKNNELLSLLSMPSTKERASKKMGEEILYLLNKPTAKEKSLAKRFQSQGGTQVTQFCDDGTRKECRKNRPNCTKLHFKKIIQKHTDDTLGDCSFLNTCFHMDTCKYVHYEVEKINSISTAASASESAPASIISFNKDTDEKEMFVAPQWIQCDLRFLDMSVLGKYAVIMADPPWDIHMELPYGTMSDDEMRHLDIPVLQDEGLIFLWVTGRAMELGRECLKLWGYDRVDELIWVKTNQLQRIIRTGRTGHWLNHGKEHCLVGMKGNPKGLNRGIDCDVIVSEVRATSHKPDEIYGIIERLSPGTKKIELFGRMHNIQPNWITLGNQVDGVKIVDSDLIETFKKRYPSGDCMSNQ